MDQEQVERSIGFILDQQAKFGAGLEEFRLEVRAQIDRVVAVQETQAGLITGLGLQLGQLAGTVDKLAGTVDKLAGTVDKLAGTVNKLADNVDRLGDKVDELAEMQRYTDGRLNIVISQVDDLIRRWGKPQ